jgi:cell division protein FtsW (lipid II flippase)
LFKDKKKNFLATIFFLIFKQPNLGSALLILGIGFSIFLCSGINIPQNRTDDNSFD